MSGKTFLDTNIIIYLYSKDENYKRDTIYEYLNKNSCITSTQVLNEASNVWFKKYKLNKIKIIEYLNGIEAVCDKIMLIQRKTINEALNIKVRCGYSYYDSLMLSSAFEGNCHIILSEDMSDGQIVNGTLKIVNPFTDN